MWCLLSSGRWNEKITEDGYVRASTSAILISLRNHEQGGDSPIRLYSECGWLNHLICTVQRYYGNTARLARRSDEAIGVRISVAHCSPPTQANRVRFPAGSLPQVPDDAAGRWVFSGISRFTPPLHSGAAPLTSITLDGFHDLDVKSSPNISTSLRVQVLQSSDGLEPTLPYREPGLKSGVLDRSTNLTIAENVSQPAKSLVDCQPVMKAVQCSVVSGVRRTNRTVVTANNWYRLFTEQRRNVRAGETGDPRENPPTRGIVRHDSHLRKSDAMGIGVWGGGGRQRGNNYPLQHKAKDWRCWHLRLASSSCGEMPASHSPDQHDPASTTRHLKLNNQ
ncbi:hypothetical protein PR048_015230 [Dryococelus australis]|uniref:Uncharacterized protein n=1 Tax=Dryococelus australis TaxID=614101 RepID=A0ABQ9HGM3_9NEOP|nr:hypothetical protein PR048_015230 [Dryococelus australis]